MRGRDKNGSTGDCRGGGVWSGFTWLRIGTGSRLWWTGDEPSGSGATELLRFGNKLKLGHQFHNIYTECPTSQRHKKTRLFGKIRKNVKREKLLKITFPIAYIALFYTGQAVMALFSLHHQQQNSWRCCRVKMTAKEGCVSRVRGGT
jgi:hypothetical protein